MQKAALALVQIALVAVVAHSMACATERQVTRKAAAAAVDPEVALRARLAALEAKGPLQFETDTDSLTPESLQVLREVAQQMFAHPRTRVVVTGHADERGDTAYNLALGERRGLAAREYLAKLGVPSGRVRVLSLGEERPAIAGHDESAWASNRRDEFTFVMPGQAAVASAGGAANVDNVTVDDDVLLVARVSFAD